MQYIKLAPLSKGWPVRDWRRVYLASLELQCCLHIPAEVGIMLHSSNGLRIEE